LRPFLYYKGFHALQWHRISHWLWHDGRRELAYFLQSRVSQAFAVDIHPAVPIGSGVFIDHGEGMTTPPKIYRRSVGFGGVPRGRATLRANVSVDAAMPALKMNPQAVF
jgi:hypothetical protein